MKNAKMIVAVVAVAALSSGCMAMGNKHGSSSGGGGGGTIAEGDLLRIEEAANRAEAAANRAEAAADRAAMASEKGEAIFHKSVQK